MRKSIDIYGNDYPTPDGTCIRDYVHIHDLAQAHLLGLERLLETGSGGIFNLGNGDGFSVKEVIETAAEIVGKKIPSKTAQRRPGDPAVLVGSSQKASAELGWQPEYPKLRNIIETAWQWHQKHPLGYES
jgi:UDP-glucose 4-epimerase